MKLDARADCGGVPGYAGANRAQPAPASATSARSPSSATARMGLSRRGPPTCICVRSPRGHGAPISAITGLRVTGCASRRARFSVSIHNTLLTKAKAVGHYVNSILAAQEARARAGTTRPCCSTSTATFRRPAARTSSSCPRGVVKTTSLPTVLFLGCITCDRWCCVFFLGVIWGDDTSRSGSRGTRSTWPTKPSSPAPPPSSCPCARSTTTRSAPASPGEITRAVQSAFEDALHGRAERYREWLDPVPDPGRPDADLRFRPRGRMPRGALTDA